MTDEQLPAYRQTVDHLLFDPRPAPRHRLRTEIYPRRPSELYPRKEPTVAFDEERDDGPVPASLEVFDPELGSDGGGWGGSALASIDPDAPVAHVDELAGRPEPVPAPRDGGDELVACPTCGAGVHPDRIRG